MARSPRPDMIAEYQWQYQEVECPICNKTFSSWYCPTCGLPKNNSSYELLDKVPYRCGSNHFREDYPTNNNYQLCSECYTPNPFHANFCRKCGNIMTDQARDKNGHGWVDLGHTCLWATEPLEGRYQWNNSQYFSDSIKFGSLQGLDDYKKSDGKDPATKHLGHNWRVPIKEEFEVMLDFAKWEKCLVHDKPAIKATSICNNNTIIIPVSDGNYLHSQGGFYRYWTASNSPKGEDMAYSFLFRDWFDILYQLLELLCSHCISIDGWEYYQKRFQLLFDFIYTQVLNNETDNNSLFDNSIRDSLKEFKRMILKTKQLGGFPSERLITLAKIIQHFIVTNAKKLWLETPVMLYYYDNLVSSFIKSDRTWKWSYNKILPVADEQLKGQL